MAKEKILILYKLLGDLLFLLLAFFFLSLIADGLIPGIVSSHISFLRIIILIVLNLSAMYAAGYAAGIDFKESRSNKKTTFFLAVVGALIVFNSLFVINHVLALIILLISAISGFFLWRMFFGNNMA